MGATATSVGSAGRADRRGRAAFLHDVASRLTTACDPESSSVERSNYPTGISYGPAGNLAGLSLGTAPLSEQYTWNESIKSRFRQRTGARVGRSPILGSQVAGAAEMLKARKAAVKSPWVFPGDLPDASILGTSLDHQHSEVRTKLKLPSDFVVHSLRQTMLTRIGEAGADAFTIMRIAGHSSVTVSQRYVHPTPENMERAFDRLQKLNALKQEEAANEAKAEAAAVNANSPSLPAKVATSKIDRSRKPPQVIAFKRTGP